MPVANLYAKACIRMLGQHHKFDVDLLSYILDAKLKHCSQMKLKNEVLAALSQGFPNLSILLCTELV